MTKKTEQVIENLKEAIASHQERIARAQEEIKAGRELLDEQLQNLEIENRRKEREAAIERGRKWKEENPEEHAAFMTEICERNRQSVLFGAEQGWWDVDEDGNMLAPPIVVDSTELPEGALMAHVMAAAGIFPSISQARKNGWDKPLTKGLFTVTKKRIRIEVI